MAQWADGGARRRLTVTQRGGALLLAAASVGLLVWYVPTVADANGELLTGSVTSNGTVYLNFASSGQLGEIFVKPGQTVEAGQLLAIQSAPAASAVTRAERAAVAADRLRLTALLAAGKRTTAANLSAARAQLDRDVAALARQLANVAGRRIIAPAAGTVLAVNGQPGEMTDPAGVRDYPALSPSTPVSQQPLFSLVPEGPQPSSHASGTALALPVVTLRTSRTWQVVVLVPQGSAAGIKMGEPVTISVPAAGLSAVRGRISELLPSPVVTSQGICYQAVVGMLGIPGRQLLTGMTANVQLAPWRG